MGYLKLSTPFDITGREFIDRRMMLTKAEMLALAYADGTSFKKRLPLVTTVPAYLAAFCTDDLCWYYYHANNPSDPETGLFTKMPGGEGGGVLIVETLPTEPDLASIYRLPDGSLHIASIDSEGYIWSTIPTGNSEGEVPITTSVIDLPDNPTPGVVYTKQNPTGNTFHLFQDGQWYELAMAWEGTQAEYDAITTKQAATIYFIKD